MPHMKLKPIRERRHRNYFTTEGEQLINYMKTVHPYPVILNGPAGCGKTQAVEQYIRRNQHSSEHIGCHPGLDIIDVIGGWQLQADEEGRPRTGWTDGPYTRAARNGSIVLMDEITRLNQQHIGRLMGSLDETRLLTLTENGAETVKLHPNFQMIATGNPPASGYNVVNLDEALKSRAMIYKYITEPLCDERATLSDILGGDETYTEAFLNWADDMRKDPTTAVSTRDLCYLAKMVGRGFDATEAITLNLRDKIVEDKRSTLMTSASAHFEV